MFENQTPPQSSINPSSNQPQTPPVSPFGPSVSKPPKPKIKTTGKITSAGILAAILVVLALAGGGGFFVYLQFFAPKSAPVNTNQNTNQTPPPEPVKTLIEAISNLIGAPIAEANEFAIFTEPAVNVVPTVSAYQVAADLSNVENKSDFTLSDSAKNLLSQNGFAVVPGYSQEFFSIYESNRYSFTPSFITTDSILHNYHLAFDFLLRTLETDKLKQVLTELTYGMVQASQEQYEQLQGTPWENAAKRNVAFFAVANKLVYPSAEPASYVAKEVTDELALIEGQTQVGMPSPVMNLGVTDPAQYNLEDYTQYIPRGHYTRTDDLKIYFKSMMYLGRLTFRLKSEDETRSAVLITQALQNSEALKNLWDKIYEPTAFFVGLADDLTFNDYGKLITDSYGADYTLTDLYDEAKFQGLLTQAANLAGPKINSMPILDARFQPDRTAAIKGFRFMGQRYTLDADIFQRLVYREVGDKDHTCDSDPTTWVPEQSRRLPSGLDVVSAFGSNVAAKLQEDKGETAYACYVENSNKMRQYVASLDGKTWTQNLYWGWLYSLRPLLAEKTQGYPSFMTNVAWQKKDMNTFLANWTELKHDTILYAKQVYAELGGGSPDQKDDRGYVEPNVYVYARLAALTKMMKEGLQLRSLLSENSTEFLDRLEILVSRLKDISEKELSNQALSDDDYDFIRTYGGSLEHLWLEAYKDLGIESPSQIYQEPAALVADVASDPAGQVLEEGTGRIYDIYAVVPVEGKLRIAKGGVFSYYEFSWPITDRLTDEKWRGMVDNNQAPALPDWTSAFVAK
ncbi:MAG: DUF3160 domain-containing protein [Patescibacteria group bacterium]|jgi:hypothetical protein